MFSSLKSNIYLQFPEEKFLQYNSGKLQKLDKLLFDLKSGKHRCLIYTQMTKMLDILEYYLNSRSYTYLRIDNTTKKSEKQILIERFNTNEKIFIFILSTRIDEINVNIIGADTVIFYDSDWNPTIDGQIQDQCHRIGQIKDVHIYRLISENTIEEKLLLGDLTVNINSLKKDNIRQLFEQTSIIENTVDSKDLIITQFEEALTSVEDEIDRQSIEEEINENQMEDDSNTIDQQVLSFPYIFQIKQNFLIFSFDQLNDMLYVVFKHVVQNIKLVQILM